MKTIEDLLNEVDYSQLDSYIPSSFALEFVNFIKLVSANTPEENQTPVIHLKMLDKIPNLSRRIINLCFRGAAKTSIFSEYLIHYIGVFGSIPGFGDVPAALFVGNSMDKGVAHLVWRWRLVHLSPTRSLRTRMPSLRRRRKVCRKAGCSSTRSSCKEGGDLA